MKHSSYYVILGLAFWSLLMKWFGVIDHPDLEYFPMSGMIALILMSWFGIFKKKAVKDDDGLTDRQREFKNKFKKAEVEETKSDIKIHMTSAEGVKSSLTVKASGEVEFEGDVDPAIRKAAFDLKDAISTFGVEAVTEELKKHIKHIEQGKKND